MKRARTTWPRAGTPSCGVGSGPEPLRSKSIFRCCGRMMISTSARSASPGVRNCPNGVSVAKFFTTPWMTLTSEKNVAASLSTGLL